jgi:P2-related tail formation protein
MMKMTVRPIVRLLSALVLLAAWHSSIPPANAQQFAPELSTAAPPISDQKLDAAAAALEQVAPLQQAYRQRLAQAATPSDQDRIVAEARGAMTKVVNDQGLSVGEFNSIIEIAKDDPEVRVKVLRVQPRGGH